MNDKFLASRMELIATLWRKEKYDNESILSTLKKGIIESQKFILDRWFYETNIDLVNHDKNKHIEQYLYTRRHLVWYYENKEYLEIVRSKSFDNTLKRCVNMAIVYRFNDILEKNSIRIHLV